MSLQARAEAHFIQTYRDNVMMVAQQMRGRIRPAVTSVPASGESVRASDLVGTIKAVRTGPVELRNINNPPTNSARWLVFPNPVKSGQYITSAEKMQRAQDPTSIYVRGHTAAVVRIVDDIDMGIVENDDGTFSVGEGGILGRASDGKTPGTAKVALPASSYTASGGLGLTLAKLMGSKEELNSNEFGLDDMDKMYAAITPQQVTDLLSLADGNGESLNAFQQMQLTSGKPTTLMGYEWIVTNRLPKDANGARMCPIWAKSNIIEGVWEDIHGDMWNDTNADNQPYARVQAFIDAVRVQDKGVHVLLCTES